MLSQQPTESRDSLPLVIGLSHLVIAMSSKLSRLSSQQVSIVRAQSMNFENIQATLTSSSDVTNRLQMKDSSFRATSDVLALMKSWVAEEVNRIPWLPLLGPEFRSKVSNRYVVHFMNACKLRT